MFSAKAVHLELWPRSVSCFNTHRLAYLGPEGLPQSLLGYNHLFKGLNSKILFGKVVHTVELSAKNISQARFSTKYLKLAWICPKKKIS